MLVAMNDTGPTTDGALSGDALTNPHWRRFPDVPYCYHVTVGCILCAISLVAVIGNVLTIAVIVKFPRLHSAVNILVVNLALSDLMLVFTEFPLYIVASFQGQWIFSEKVCELYGFFGGAFGLLSINTLAAIAVERCNAITQHGLGIKQDYMRRACLMVVVVWIYALGWAMPPLLGWNRYTWEGFGTTCSFDYLAKSSKYTSFIWSMFFGGFILPLAVIISCYTLIFISVVRHKNRFREIRRKLKDRHISSNCFSTKRKRTEIKTAITMLLCVICYCVAWTPYAVVALMGVLRDGARITPLMAVIPGLFAKASTIYNPIIYSLCHPRIQSMLCSLPCSLSFERVPPKDQRVKDIPLSISPYGQRKSLNNHEKSKEADTPDTGEHLKTTRLTSVNRAASTDQFQKYGSVRYSFKAQVYTDKI